MHEARLGADDFRQMGEEGDDVVLGFALDLVDPRDVEGRVFGLGPDRLCGVLRNHAEFRLRIRRVRLDLEPDLEARLRLPDGGHFRAGVAGNHSTTRGSSAYSAKVGTGFAIEYALIFMGSIFLRQTGFHFAGKCSGSSRALAEQPRRDKRQLVRAVTPTGGWRRR